MDTLLSPLLASAIKPAFEIAGSRIKRTVNRRRNGTVLKDLDLASTFDTSVISERVSGLSTVESLPSDLSISQLKHVLAGPRAQGIIGEILAHRITGIDPIYISTVREQFYILLVEALHLPDSKDSRKTTDLLVDELDFLCEQAVERIRAGDPDAFQSLRDAGQLRLLIETANASKRHLEHVRKYKHEVLPSEHQEWIENYRDQLVAAHGHIYPPNIDDRQKVPIEDIYVAPEISQSEDGSYRTVRVADYVNTIDRTVLLGDPGGGKSTMTAAITTLLAKESSRIPFIVTLRDFARETNLDRSILAYITSQLETQYQCPAPVGAVESLLLTGEAFVIFDGLDELLDSSLRRTISERVELFSSRYPLSRVLATSRIVGYPEARLDPQFFTTHIIGGFSESQVAEYSRKWFTFAGAFPGSDVETVADTFLSESNQVPDLRRNPLMLSLICMIYRGQNYIPENRLRVLEKCAELLYNRWDRSRAIIVDFRASAHVDDALRHLAYWMYRSPEAIEGVTERELIRESTDFLSGKYRTQGEALEAAKEFISFCKGRAWVFGEAGTTPTGEAIFKFAHRTFLEYFAAHELTRNSDSPEEVASVLLKHISKAEWDVVGQLSVQIVHEKTRDGATRVLLRLLRDGRRRKLINQLNILAFVGRCLSFSPASPDVSKLFIQKSVANLLRQLHENPSDPLVTEALDALQNIHHDLLEYSERDLRTEVECLLSSDDEAARKLGRSIAVSYFKFNSEQWSSKHAMSWQRWSESVIRDNVSSIKTPECEAIHLLSLQELRLANFEEVLSRAAGGGHLIRGLFQMLPEPLLHFFVIPLSDQILRVIFTPPHHRTWSENHVSETLQRLDAISDLNILNVTNLPAGDFINKHNEAIRPSSSLIFPRDENGGAVDSSIDFNELLNNRGRYWVVAALTMIRFEIDVASSRRAEWPGSSNPFISATRARSSGGTPPMFFSSPLSPSEVEFMTKWMAGTRNCIA
ncbi:clpB protein [Brachybacterium sp. SW0106-09]|uniref:NACHT domain-containing protein n=1 Tax=Brachybacterium sp. SW0106-09 TaxID=1704590 RepID=UPI0006C27E3D|nr:NACHT domain-containing protein [Brachybacterium sp. SW0106-09]GAP77811.1 clpB protein [Brachybacterium sp. SW0106-09]